MTAHEGSLNQDVEALRARFNDTQELYKEVAALLFFRYGQTPTANRLYQLVRKGSMSAPARALNDFWETLRATSRVKVGHADIPESLRTQTGEVLNQLWEIAIQDARQSFEVFTAEAQQHMETAQQERNDALDKLQLTEMKLQQTKEKVNNLEREGLALQQENTATQATLESQQQHLAEAKYEREQLLAQLQTQHQQFTDDLNALHHSIKLTEERAQATEKKALLEVDALRTEKSQLQQQLKTGQQQLESLQAELQRQRSQLQHYQDQEQHWFHTQQALESQLNTNQDHAAALQSEHLILEQKLLKEQHQHALTKQSLSQQQDTQTALRQLVDQYAKQVHYLEQQIVHMQPKSP